MGLRSSIITALAIAASTAAVHATDLVFPERGRAALVDAAHVLPPVDAAALNARVAAWDNATGHQLAIATVPTLQGREIADYGYQLGRAWGLGRKGINDGILFLIAPTEHRVRIDVGRGLEGDLTDVETSVILHDAVVPKLKAGDAIGAVSAGADAIMRAVPAGAGDMANAPKPSDWGSFWTILMIYGGLTIAVMLIGVLRIVLLAKRAAKEERDRFVAMRQRHDDKRQLAETEIVAGARPTARRFDLHTPIGGAEQRIVRQGQRYPISAAPPAPPRGDTTIIAPVIINEPSYSPPPSYSSDSSSSGSDFGSSSGFDSGGGDFGGGGSDSSW